MTPIEKAQRRILSTLIHNHQKFNEFSEACELVQWDEPYRTIYRAMVSGTRSFFLLAENKEVTKIHQSEKLLKSLVAEDTEVFLTDLIHYAAEITNRNKTVAELQDLLDSAPTIDEIQTRLNAISGTISGLYRNTSFDMEKLNQIQSNAVEKQKNGGNVSLKCGFKAFQRQIMGWHKGHLTVLGGNSSAGKTALSLSCIKQAAIINNVSVAVISYELTPREIHARLIGGICEVQPRDILFTPLSDSDFKRFHSGLSEMEKLKIIIDKPEDNDIETLVAKLRYLKSIGVELVCIDFLQLIRDKKIKDKFDRVGSNARRLKNVAHELDLPIILLSQLNRENVKSSDKRPTLASLRDSGEIEEAADEVVLMYREEYFLKEQCPPELKGKVELIFAKGRSTGTGNEIMNYDTQYQRFTDEEQNFGELRDYTESSKRLNASAEF